MKTKFNLLFASFAAAALSALPGAARADNIFVNDGGVLREYTTSGATVNASLATGVGALAASGGSLYVVQSGGTIGQYDASGTLVNASLISGLTAPGAIAVAGGDIFVQNGGTIVEYTTAGALVNASLVTGLTGNIQGIAAAGGDVFVADFFNADNSPGTTISQYDATSGGLLNASFITGLNGPVGIAVAGGNLFVANNLSESVGEYTTAGTPVNASLVPYVPSIPRAIAVSGNDVFVAAAAYPSGPSLVAEYNATTGATVNGSLIPGLSGPSAIAVVQTPEPSTLVMLVIGAAALLASAIRKRRVRA